MGKQSQVTAWLKNLACPAKGQKDYDAPGSTYGLKLRVFASDRKTWFVRGRVRGAESAPKYVTLGDYHADKNPQSAAEEAARQARILLRQGIDPLQQREESVIAARVESMTFGALVEEYLVKGTGNLRANTLKGRALALRGKHFADWRDRPLAYLTQGRVKALADTIPVSSHAVILGGLRRVLNYAEEHGYIARAPKVEVKQAQGDAAPFFDFQEGGKPDFAELGIVLDALDVLAEQQPLSPWPCMWTFASLTGARSSAYQGLRWEELDLSSAPVWHLPAARSKLKRDIDIPLSDAAAALLRSLPRKESGLIWPGRFADKPREDLPGDQVGMLRGMLAARGFRAGFWPGRFRDTVMTWLDVQDHASERAIALLVDHRAPSERTTRGRHYAKFQSDALARRLANEWAAIVAKVRKDAAKAGPAVVPMAAAKKARRAA